MATEGTIQLNQDASVANKNVIRVVEVLPREVLAEYIASGNLPMQEVVVLADKNGQFICAVDGGALRSIDEEAVTYLKGICARLDLLLSKATDFELIDNLGLGGY